MTTFVDIRGFEGFYQVSDEDEPLFYHADKLLSKKPVPYAVLPIKQAFADNAFGDPSV